MTNPDASILPTASSLSASAALAQSLATKSNYGSTAAAPAAALLLMTPSRRQAQLQRFLHIISSFVTVASMASSAVAMYFTQTVLIYVAFSFSWVMGPWVLFQKCRLRGLSPLWLLRQTIRKVQHEANRLHELNDVFSQEVTRLQREQAKLRGVEQQLEQTVAQHGGDMREMKRLLQEYGRIQRQMKRLTAAQELQHLMAVLLEADTDKDRQFSEKEVDKLLVRLKTFNVVDRSRLRSVFQMASSKSLRRMYQAAAQDFTAYDCNDMPSAFGMRDEEGLVDEKTAFDYKPWSD